MLDLWDEFEPSAALAREQLRIGFTPRLTASTKCYNHRKLGRRSR